MCTPRKLTQHIPEGPLDEQSRPKKLMKIAYVAFYKLGRQPNVHDDNDDLRLGQGREMLRRTRL